MDNNLKICFVGSGTISTAMGNVLAMKGKCDVFLLFITWNIILFLPTSISNITTAIF